MPPDSAVIDAITTKAHNLDLLMQVINLLPNPVYVKDSAHLWVEVNQAFCDFLGYQREELLGKSDFDFNPSEQAQVFWDKDDEVFQTHQDNINIEETTNSAGELRWVESRKTYFKSEDGEEFIIGVLTDITDMKAREARLIQAEKQAIAGAESKASFLANMSHEIRTPMNGVLGMAQILRSSDLNKTQLEMVDTLLRSGDALMQVINDVLDFSKIDANEISLDPQPFIMKDMVEDVSTLLGVTAREKDLDLIISMDEAAQSGFLGDSGRLRQILTNLLSNAIKFTETGFVSVTVNINATDDADVAEIEMVVKDSGIGIPADKCETIFEKFQQADGSTTRLYGGTGLGLSITKSLTELMGGTISVQSALGEGTVFSVDLSLPFAAVEAAPERLSDTLSPIASQKILIVDDIVLNLNITESQLKQIGLECDRTESAQEAARMLSEAKRAGAPYDVLLTDYQMPKIDGLQLIRSIRNNPQFSNLRIIALSSVGDLAVREAFLAQENTAYLTKPAKLRDIHAALLPQTAEPLKASA